MFNHIRDSGELSTKHINNSQKIILKGSKLFYFFDLKNQNSKNKDNFMTSQ